MGSKIRGKIPEPGYSILRQKREFLCNELVARHIVDLLYSYQILDEDDKDRIENAENHSKRDGVRMMLDLLADSGPNAYAKFLEALREKGYEHAADELESTVVQPSQDPLSWIDDIPAEKKTMPLKEKNLLTLSNYMGDGWESVVLSLGNSEAQLHHDKQNNQFNAQMQLFSALNRWRQRKASDATVIALLTAMRSCPRSKIDWDSVRKYVMQSL